MAFIPTIGQMNMVLKFEKVVKSSDQTGGQNEAYVDWFTTRGYFRNKRNYRQFETGYDESVKTFEAWIYWRNAIEVDLSKDVRIEFEARSFAIDMFTLVGEKRKMYKLELTEVR
jgi:SPP1 family predicted phage head-tail adaptor